MGDTRLALELTIWRLECRVGTMQLSLGQDWGWEVRKVNPGEDMLVSVIEIGQGSLCLKDTQAQGMALSIYPRSTYLRPGVGGYVIECLARNVIHTR